MNQVFFRVGNSTYLSCRKALEAVQADVTLTTAEHGFNACLNHFSRVLFINGLKSGVKPITEAKFCQLNDTRSLLAAVVEAEVAAADRRDRVNALEMEISALQKQTKTWLSGSTGSGPAQKAVSASATASKPQASGASSGPAHRQKPSGSTASNASSGENIG